MPMSQLENGEVPGAHVENEYLLTNFAEMSVLESVVQLETVAQGTI